MSQIHKTLSLLSDLYTTLQVYEGLFAKSEDADKLVKPFPEIGKSLNQSLKTQLIIGCAALFTDPDETYGNQNLSFRNFIKQYKDKLSPETEALIEKLFDITKRMNLKTYRNKFVGHYGLDELLGNEKVTATINIDNLREILKIGQQLINMIVHDAKLMPENESFDFFNIIPSNRSTNTLLDKINKIA